MKKIKKVFLGVGTLWSAMIAKIYATNVDELMRVPMQTAYGIPQPEPKISGKSIIMLAITAIIVGLNFILRKKIKEKKNLLNIILIIFSVVVTVLVIIFISSLVN